MDDPYTYIDENHSPNAYAYVHNHNAYAHTDNSQNAYAYFQEQQSHNPYTMISEEFHDPYTMIDDFDTSLEEHKEEFRSQRKYNCDLLDFGKCIQDITDASTDCHLVHNSFRLSRKNDHEWKYTVNPQISAGRKLLDDNNNDGHEEEVEDFFKNLDTNQSLRDIAKFVKTIESRMSTDKILNRLVKALEKEVFQLVQSTNDEFYWGDIFQKAQSLDDESAKNLALSQLATDFSIYSSLYAETIVQELGLPSQLRSIDSVKVGGVAGGSKYITCASLYKFPKDVCLRDGLYLYAGPSERGSDELAMKAASNELLAANEYSKSLPENYSVPMQSVIDFMGFRIIAMPLLPIRNDTIVYGSGDGMKHVHFDADVNEVLKQTAVNLHLAEHEVCGHEDEETSMICTAGDVEIHKDASGSFYILDLARVFPPLDPLTCNEVRGLRSGPHAIFYRTMRPEFLRRLANLQQDPLSPVSSDALSGWGRINSEIYNRHAVEATEYLLYPVLERMSEELDILGSALENVDIAQLFHKKGINMHFLGAISALCQNLDVVRLLTLEMLKRTVKNLLRRALRSKQRQSYDWISPFSIKVTVVNFLNSVCGSGDSFDILTMIKEKMLEQFGEGSTGNGFLESILHQNCVEIVQRVLKDCGVSISENCIQKFKKIGMGFSFTAFDLDDFKSRTRSLAILERSITKHLLSRSSELMQNSFVQYRLRKEAITKNIRADYEFYLQLDPVLQAASLSIKEAWKLCEKVNTSREVLLECLSRAVHENEALLALTNGIIRVAVDLWDTDVFFALSKVLGLYSVVLESERGSWQYIIGDSTISEALIERVIETLKSEMTLFDINNDSEDIDSTLVYLCAAFTYVDGFVTENSQNALKDLCREMKPRIDDTYQNETSHQIVSNLLNLFSIRCGEKKEVFAMCTRNSFHLDNRYKEVYEDDYEKNSLFLLSETQVLKFVLDSLTVEKIVLALIRYGRSDLDLLVQNIHVQCSRESLTFETPAGFFIFMLFRLSIRCMMFRHLIASKRWMTAKRLFSLIEEDLTTIDEVQNVQHEYLSEFIFDNVDDTGLPSLFKPADYRFSDNVDFSSSWTKSDIQDDIRYGLEAPSGYEDTNWILLEMENTIEEGAVSCGLRSTVDRRLWCFENAKNLLYYVFNNLSDDDEKPLRTAISMHNTGMEKIGSDVEATTLLQKSGSRGLKRCSLFLCELNEIDFRNDKYIMMETAASRGDTVLLTVLLELGVPPDPPSILEHSPLLSATEEGHSEAIRILCEHGASIEFLDEKLQPAILLASERGRTEALEELIRQSSDPNFQHFNGTPLTKALEYRHTETAMHLLTEYDIDVNEAIPSNGRTPLMLAASSGSVSLVNLLLKQGADIHARDHVGDTALQFCAYTDNLEVLVSLIYAGASLNSRNICGETALMKADNPHIVEFLLTAGANIDLKTTNGYDALLYSITRINSEKVVALLEAGANVDTKQSQGYSALMIACSTIDPNIVKLLIDAGADVNYCNENKTTALMCAIRHHNSESINLLLKAGADISAQTKEGQSTISIARKYDLRLAKELQELMDAEL